MLLFFPSSFFTIPQTGIDNSWKIALHLARQNNLVFGKDFVFTYGPLGILFSRLPIAVNKFIYILFDLYFMVTVFFIIKRIIFQHFSYGAVIFIYLCTSIIPFQQIDQQLFLFFLFFLFSFIEKPGKNIYILQAAGLSIISLYLKVSLGITALFIFALALHYCLILKKISVKKYAVIAVFNIIVIILTAGFFHVALKSYLLASFQFIRDYNDAMYTVIHKEDLIFLYSAGLIILVFLIWSVFRIVRSYRKKELRENADELFRLVIMGMAVFTLFKSGFVRSDVHLYMFFINIGQMAALLFLFQPQPVERKVLSGISWFVLIIGFWAANALPGSYQPYRQLIDFSFLRIRAEQINNYFNELKRYDHELAASQKLRSTSNEIRRIIGDSSVDIIPYEISTIYFNGLNYNPRPVVQSYAAYNLYFDSLNALKYSSPDGPAYVLFSSYAIDKRFSFFEESRTKLALFQNYELAGEVNDLLLLKKRSGSKRLIRAEEEKTVTFKMGEDIPVDSKQGFLFSRIFVDYNFWGKLRGLFYQPPELKITMTLDDGQKVDYSVIKPIFAGGILLNKYVEDETEFQLWMLSDDSLSAKVRSFRIEPDSANRGFKKEIRMINTYYVPGERSVSQSLKDSLKLAELIGKYNGVKPQLIDTSVYLKDSILIGVFNNKSYSRLGQYNGWAMRKNGDNRNYVIKAVVMSRDGAYLLPTGNHFREDIGVFFNRHDLLHAAFTSRFDRSLLPPGDYQLGGIITDSPTKRSWINFTDQHFLIRGQSVVEKMKKEVSTSVNKDSIQFYIESINNEGGNILVNGWAFGKNGDPTGTVTNLILENGDSAYRVNTDMVLNENLALHFKIPSLRYNGFSALIPHDVLPKGIYHINIEKVYPKGGRSLEPTHRNVRIKLPEMSDPVVIAELPPVRNFDEGTDFLKDGEDELTISGWAIQDKTKVDSSTIDIILTNGRFNYVFPAEERFRPDVTAYFNNKMNLDRCGFFARMSKKDLPPGKYRIGIHIYRNDGKGEVKFLDQSITKK